jgi:DNA modification methylase
MFPPALVETPIKACCPEGGVVLDPFCGSGTTLKYCQDNNIDAIGIEINPEFEAMIARKARIGLMRIEDFL